MRAVMKTRAKAKLMRVGAPAVAALVILSLLHVSSAGAQSDSAEAAATVPRDWAHTPPGLQGGDSFRLLFIDSTEREARSTDIGHYNRNVQAAANANDNFKPFASRFRVLGSTVAVSARDNTGTAPAGSSYTTGEGVPIYWVNGDKVADDYGDFYDGTWDSYTSKDELGRPTSAVDVVYTGTANDGRTSSVVEGGKTYVPALGVLPVTVGKLSAGNVFASGSYYRQLQHPNHFYALSPVITIEDTIPVAGDWEYVPEGAGVGDKFRLIFMTSETIGAGGPNQVTYINHVKDRAAENSALAPYRNDFSALVSTQYHDARDLTRTNTARHGPGVPIYWLGGQKVADDYADFYCGGGWDSQAARNEQGRVVNRLEDRWVWTGSNCDGTKTAYKYLSSEHPMAGKPAGADGGASKEINSGFTRTKTDQHHLYAMSPIFTVATSPPAVRRQAPAATPTTTTAPEPTEEPAANKQRVRLRPDPLFISENGGVSTVTAWLVDPVSEPVTVTVSAVEIRSGEAQPRLFTLSDNRTLTVAAGETKSTGVVTITAVDNDRRGSNCCTWETDVDVTVSGTVTGPAKPTAKPAGVTISDDEPVGGL